MHPVGAEPRLGTSDRFILGALLGAAVPLALVLLVLPLSADASTDGRGLLALVAVLVSSGAALFALTRPGLRLAAVAGFLLGLAISVLAVVVTLAVLVGS